MADYEQIYDEKIAPIMTQIIDICKEYGVSMFADFKLKDETENEDAYYCTTCLSGDDQPQKHKDLYNVSMNGYVVEKPFFISSTIISK